MFNEGLQGLWAIVGHFFFSKQLAHQNSTQVSIFPEEIGLLNLGFAVAVAAVLSFKFVVWIDAIVLITTIFYANCIVVRVQRQRSRDCVNWCEFFFKDPLIFITAGFFIGLLVRLFRC